MCLGVCICFSTSTLMGRERGDTAPFQAILIHKATLLISKMCMFPPGWNTSPLQEYSLL